MITSQDFARIVYRYPKLKGRGTVIHSMLGVDSEAYDTGEPFMFCVSDGYLFRPSDVPLIFFQRYSRKHFAVYNLKYDSGALLYFLPKEQKLELWEKNKTAWEVKGSRVHVEYIPHKFLTFWTNKNTWVKFWDVSQYYKMSLDEAAKRYLGKSKLDVETKKFSRRYVRENWDRLKRYCVKDAKLCAELGTFFVRKCAEFGIRATSLYSCASLSFRYYADRGKIVTSWRFWKYWKGLLAFSMDAYEGGKFEITARGSFNGYEYDLVSAYPYEIANLVDISNAKVIRTNEYQEEAVYGFLRVFVRNPDGKHIPCGLMIDKVRVYPAGEFYTTITKQEYDYLEELGVEVLLLDGFWLVVGGKRYPYRKTTAELYALKAKYKATDPMLTALAKYMMNSYYGKNCQMIEDWRGRVVAGIGWNPMYASVITANTRIKMCRIQNLLGAACLAVHTDSVITTEELPGHYVTGKLGDFAFEDKGPGILVACGQYELGDKAAYKGFEPLQGDDWRRLLEMHPRATTFTYPIVKVESWVEATAKGHFDKVNYFSDEEKAIDLNGDTKRIWVRRVRGRDLLTRLEQSLPRPVVHTEPPDYWS